ncbi:MAG: hypothetical protein ACRC2R_17950 [Xenococcaceae cyanobacterium]
MLLKLAQISKSALKSQVVRNLIGERAFDAAASLAPTGQSGGGLLSKIFNGALKFVGFLLSAACGFIAWSATTLVDIVVEAYFEIKYFDWNQTDKDLEAEIKASNIAIVGALGGLTGTGLVWLTGIAVAGGLTVKFPVLAGQIALRLAEEGGDEIRGELVNLLTTTRQSIIKGLILGGLLTLRKLRWFGLAPVTQEKPPWTIAEAIDKLVEKIPNDYLEAFVRGFLDRVEESLIEMGYVIAFTVDDYYASQRTAAQDLQTRTLSITPDRSVPDERFIVQADQPGLIHTVQSALVNHNLVHNRDVGQIVGQTYDDWYKSKPFRRSMTVYFFAKPKPPWVMPDGKRAQKAEITIPDPKPGLNWQEIKLACNPYLWGPIIAQWDLDNGRCLKVFAATKAEAVKKLKEILPLTTANPVKPIFFGEPDDDTTPPELKRKPRQMYPAYANLTIRESVPGTGNAWLAYQKNKEASKTRIELYHDAEPPDFIPIPA